LWSEMQVHGLPAGPIHDDSLVGRSCSAFRVPAEQLNDLPAKTTSRSVLTENLGHSDEKDEQDAILYTTQRQTPRKPLFVGITRCCRTLRCCYLKLLLSLLHLDGC
jgi:hypothetical protein